MVSIVEVGRVGWISDRVFGYEVVFNDELLYMSCILDDENRDDMKVIIGCKKKIDGKLVDYFKFENRFNDESICFYKKKDVKVKIDYDKYMDLMVSLNDDFCKMLSELSSNKRVIN